MLQGWVVVTLALAYIGLLFLVASLGDRLRLRGVERRTRRFIYALSLAVYCTSWTFFGSVGLASHAGFDFLAIYIGPIILIGFAWPLLIRVVRLAKAQNITSIADFIAARYGKNQAVAALVTVHRGGRRGALYRAAAQGGVGLARHPARATSASNSGRPR